MKNQFPLVSVCVPVYNHEDYVKKCIESIVTQTYTNIELLVIDDGSTDNSKEILETLSSKYKFQYRSRENIGLNATLEELYSKCSGKYIALIASDDFFHPEKIEKQVNTMEEDEDIKMTFTEHFDVDSDNIVLQKGIYNTHKKEIYKFEDILMYADMPPASLMFRRDALPKTEKIYTSLGLVDDLYIWLKLLEEGGYAKVIPEALTYYRTHDSNTHSDNIKIAKGHFKTVEYFKSKAKNWKKIEVEWSIRNANLVARSNKNEALQYLKKGFSKFWDIRIYKTLAKIFLIKK